MFHRSLVTMLASVVVVAIVVSACGGDEPTPSQAIATATTIATSTVTEPTVVAQDIALTGTATPIDPAQPPNVIKATSLMGYGLQNAEGADLGTIRDVMVLLQDGSIKYLALSFGGFLGIGENYFLVPWSAVAVNPQEETVVVNVVLSQEMLDSSPYFAADNWPNTALPDWDAEYVTFWQNQPGMPMQPEGGIATPTVGASSGVSATPSVTSTMDVTSTMEMSPTTGVSTTPTPAETGVSTTPTPAEGEMQVNLPAAVRISEFLDYDITNTNGEDVGEIEDVMIDWRQGQVGYAVLSFGGFLGLGEKWFAIPWSAFTLDPVNQMLILDIDQEALETAPGFDQSNWPDSVSTDWDQEIRQYWELRQQRLQEQFDQLQKTPTPAQ